MPGNTTPLHPLTPVFPVGVTLTAANTAKDGTGTTALLYTAGANGGLVKRVRAMALGTNPASVLRVFVNNGSTPGTAANNSMFAAVSLPATTNTEVAAVTSGMQELPNLNTVPDASAFPLVLPAGYRLYACLGTAVAAGWAITAEAADF